MYLVRQFYENQFIHFPVVLIDTHHATCMFSAYLCIITQDHIYWWFLLQHINCHTSIWRKPSFPKLTHGGRHKMTEISQTTFFDPFSRIRNFSAISINIPLKFVPKSQNNNILSLVQIIAWRRPGDMPLSEPMMERLLRHICVTPQWVKIILTYLLCTCQPRNMSTKSDSVSMLLLNERHGLQIPMGGFSLGYAWSHRKTQSIPVS